MHADKLTTLPSDALCNILSAIKQGDEEWHPLASVRAACRLLREAVDAQRVSLCIGKPGPYDSPSSATELRKLLSRCPLLAELRAEAELTLEPRTVVEAAVGAGPRLRATLRALSFNVDSEDCEEVDFSVSPLTDFVSLCRLELTGAVGRLGTRSLTLLSSLTGLVHLGIQGSPIDDLGILSPLKFIQHLDISSCLSVTDLAPLTALSALQHLDISSVFQISSLNPLSLLTSLAHLVSASRKRGVPIPFWCIPPSSAYPLQHCLGLQSLSLNSVHTRLNLDHLDACSRLCKLELLGCIIDAIPQPAFAGIPSLVHLDLSDCSVLCNGNCSWLSCMRNVTHLKFVCNDGENMTSENGALTALLFIRSLPFLAAMSELR